MHCHILVPGFGLHAGAAAGLCDGLPAGALETLIARGRRVRAPARGTERWLLERFGVERQHDWPAAPFRLLGDGGSPGAHAWICADPVHMRFEQNRLVLADSTKFSLAPDEAATLAACINSHFSDVLNIHAQQPQRWYARLADCPDIEATPLAAARARAVETRLPRGPGAMRWQALMNEMQMLLHEHPLNLAREARGEPTVNSLWLWGAGVQPQQPTRPFQFVAAEDPLARGLALACGAQALELAPGPQDWAARAGVGLVVLDALASPADYDSADDWRAALAGLESAWFSPLLEALKARRIGMLTLHLLGPGHALEVEVTDTDLRRFWRRRQPLGTWLAQAASGAEPESERAER